MSNDPPVENYRRCQIIFHVDAGHLVIYRNEVVHSASTREEAKAWIDEKENLK